MTASPSARCSTTAATPEQLIRDTHSLLESAGIHRSPNWVAKMVRSYLRSTVAGLPFGQVLAAKLQLTAQQRVELEARSELRYVLEYSDPTGETAVRNVMARAS
ncbi:hypothetical protein [Blastococcus sp. CCUG 61487]|uniref:hypothetical protein n=1 Tax=Blastococcus sp. CCUG 61487 TaxID=1840703 RepID=UPI0010C06558|nr:hypothetical protein [Blastococcus sp. CCUG 61487]